MADCEKLQTCPFYNIQMSALPGMSKIYRKKYCKGDNSKCARYIVYKTIGKEMIPLDLFPNMMDRAKRIIEENR